ncbi:UDP-N-acetylglucosamine 1-carboxyvinyltransferase [Paracoccaceae bacterium]|nr:UDP-N-acetylglucosamine 1-carboxyvinyltransferase [Paracoccaceae bacterium]
MDSILVTGNGPLNGKIPIAGAKNACLALMPVTLLTDQPVTLTNAPILSDIKTAEALLSSLGTEVSFLNGGKVLVMSSHNLKSSHADYDIVRKMRASNLVLGPLLARTGEAVVSLPGGCAIGARPMDLHIGALEALGATIELKEGYLHAKSNGRLKAGTFEMRMASVGATENFIMAATLANGTSVLKNAAKEPEIVDLVKCLRSMGAQITGEGSSTLEIQGVDTLGGTTHPIVVDRIELGTYMIAPAITGGQVDLVGGKKKLLGEFWNSLERVGLEISETADGIRAKRVNEIIKAVDVKTEVYPGFATDLQAQFMALMCLADGTSFLEETLFENRFMHAPELIRMGAKIDVQGGIAKVQGVSKLKGAPVMATDLRASVSLILAGLAAEGETKVARVYHLDRGYENLVSKLSNVGAKIERISD